MRILLVIDGSNFFFTQKNILGWMIDPAKLKDYVSQWGDVVEARYYLSVKPGEQTEGGERYRKALCYIGYSVIPVDIKRVFTSNGMKEKEDTDVRIAVDTVAARNLYDEFVLVSGDSDFCYLLETLKAFGKSVRVLSTKGIVSTEILECVGGNFYDLRELRFCIVKG